MKVDSSLSCFNALGVPLNGQNQTANELFKIVTFCGCDKVEILMAIIIDFVFNYSKKVFYK